MEGFQGSLGIFWELERRAVVRLQRSASVHLLLLIHRVAFLSCLGERSFQKMWPPQSTHQLRTLWVLRSKEPACNAEDAGDLGSVPESGGSPGGGHGNPLQFSCPENPMDRGAWRAMVHRVRKSWTWLKRLSRALCPVRFPSSQQDIPSRTHRS